ncbi:tyrosine-type recombinase/integrase [Sphingomonas hankookensis]|uniref:tyrosine-type recombinase/integrase n=1 Tax=Sphingomonas hankookensis TaxID=563996 RepID=UPI001F576DE6|nr:site-specific integrase [Sphingomonas hankookensis]
MPTPARVLEAADVRRLLQHVRANRYAKRDTVLILLSFKAGLRAGEIAGLSWTMVLGPSGKVDTHIAVSAKIAKKGSGRRIPINPDLHRALVAWHRSCGSPRDGPVILSERGRHMHPRSIVNWFAGMYQALSLDGCSSHSGRRTFITRTARLLAQAGGSLRDVQELAGHRSLTTTERYIEGDRDAQRALVRLV